VAGRLGRRGRWAGPAWPVGRAGVAGGPGCEAAGARPRSVCGLLEALRSALPLLRCPRCGSALREDGAVRCDQGHAFDVARQGYLSLLAGARPPAGDDAAMVAARERVLGAGWFAPLTAALARAAAPGARRGALVDLGGGTGHHLAGVLDAAPDRLGLVLDVSRYALRRAARAHPRAAAVGADTWGALPLGDGVAASALCVFAPRNGAELARVLAPGGVLVVATPAPEHLAALVEALDLLRVDPRKDERLAEQLAGGFELIARERVEWTLELERDEAAALAAMGPSAFHADVVARAAQLPATLTVTGAVTVASYGVL
jgi:23S rRNA (guanine745-N1)-methyltransferase